MVDQPTPISSTELDELAGGELVEIPHWKAGQTMWVRIRYVDLTPQIAAVMQPALPNPLRGSVDEAFDGPKPSKTDGADDDGADDEVAPEVMEAMPEILDTAAREALVEPSYADLESRGLALTMSQKLAIFQEVMGELEGLEGFRALTADVLPGPHGPDAPVPAK